MFQEILQGLGGGSVQQPVTVPSGYQDPVANMNFLEKLGLGLGGVGAVNQYRQTGIDMQTMQRKAEERQALKDLSDRMQNGELDDQQALREYAGITGDYSGIFGVGARAPAALQEWAAYNKMSPEDQKRYLQMKRSNQMFDRGGSQVVLDSQGNVITEFDKTIPPEQTPAAKAEQTAAIEAEKTKAANQASADKKSREATEVMSLADQAEQYLSEASGSYLDTGKSFGKRVIGMSDAETQANAALKVISGKLVSNMPRMEGPQSDKDVQLYKDMAANIADPSVPAQDKRVALQALRDLNAKYSNNSGNVDATSAGDGGTGGRKTIKFGDLQ